MDSYKPFSTIGYNTESFLLNRLDEFKNQYPDSFWCYIYHRNEEGKKDHYHLYIEPNARLRNDDFVMLRKNFEEPDPDPSQDKPLSCMPFRKSNSFEDWYLYAVHDTNYLNAKHLVKSTYDYDDELVISSDREYLDSLRQEIDSVKYLSPIDKMHFCVDNGMNMYQALSYLRIPYSGMYGFMKIWKDMQDIQERIRRQEISDQIDKLGQKKDSTVEEKQLDILDLENDDLPF